MFTQDEARKKIEFLIKNYENIKSLGRIKEYNEANTRKDFILPLFSALGWDVYNQDEVKEEESASKGRVDYCFRLKSIPKFFLEAKALKINIDELRWAEQAINYAWHKGVSWAILCDFEGIRIYNAEWKTKSITDSLFISLNYDEYLTRFNQLWLLSKKSFTENLLDKEAEKWGKKTKKTPVQDIIFQDLMHWRTILSKGINKYPRINNLKEEELDECVQRILDRLIFIRTCEDREIEKVHLLSTLRDWQTKRKGKSLSDFIIKIFRDFDDGYDSNLFQKHLCENLKIDDDVLVEIIEGLYQTKDETIRYDFSSIPADILGGIYEQYLGHILRKTQKRAKVKKEHRKRKEQGIYYTPTYIVDYIVQNTVGELLKTLPYRKAINIKILDPACGSGSFLIKAFEIMDEYLKEERKSRSEFDVFRRTEILTKNIYGVDLDSQAVEIARLNLLLKTLQTRAKLPDLAKNIKCGNSLISGNELELFKYFGDDYQKKKPYDWQTEFSEVFKDGGFDVVIGNPPYVRFHLLPKDDIDFYRSNFLTADKWFDTFCLMIERGINLLKDGGKFGFIIPSLFLKGFQYVKLRKFILDNTKIISINDFGDGVFGEVQMPTCIIILEKREDSEDKEKNILLFRNNFSDGADHFLENKISQKYFSNNELFSFDTFIDNIANSIIKKMNKNSIKLDQYVQITRGIEISKKHPDISLTRKKDDDIVLLAGEDIDRYRIKNKKYLPIRILTKFAKDKKIFENPKIIIRETGSRIVATYDDKSFYTLRTIYNMILIDKTANLKYILGILNSNLFQYFYVFKYKADTDIFPKIRIAQVRQLPIRKIDFSNPDDVKIHNDLVALVDKMFSLNKRLATLGDKLTDERTHLEKEISRTDKEIDELVYRLYGLSEEEIKIVEEMNK